MNLREIKDLINLMNEHGLGEIEIESEGTKIKLKKGNGVTVEHGPVQMVQTPIARSAETAGEKPAPPKNGQTIKSPMVGTFYTAPAPDADPYLKVGAQVEVGQVVCIIEAMKLMNEIKSEVKGVVAEIHAQNGDPVEFGQLLFSIACSFRTQTCSKKS